MLGRSFLRKPRISPRSRFILLLALSMGTSARADDTPAAKAEPAALDPAVAQEIEKARETYWAFQPAKDTPPPAVHDAAWPLNAIDRFILARLEEKGLKAVPVAD